jgi:hypothetical protein
MIPTLIHRPEVSEFISGIAPPVAYSAALHTGSKMWMASVNIVTEVTDHRNL